MRVATRLSLVVYQHPACIGISRLPSNFKGTNWVICSFNVVHSLNISMDYSNRSHTTQQNNDTELLAFRRSKNRLVGSQWWSRSAFLYLFFVWLLVSPKTKIIKLTILDLAWFSSQASHWHCLDASSQVEWWIHQCTSCSFHQVFLAQAYLR